MVAEDCAVSESGITITRLQPGAATQGPNGCTPSGASVP
ncbi:hypothetical protein KPSA3_04320 [Pseudomonas syringae pv. actinidiae]|uniref:Uncharacterized protein n=1 Tax=Pseudomonas syringae pv. actinidiae TaxID=103796 RepID=A0AAN4Q6B4_PSESF|nr:hypothetical protein KPSA3_04320 [Pseudomonas syringae pv. actinidiae]